jgi:gamma-glutamyl:cysteine ligase YbdK (ATP-grasp superfamily)
MSDDTDNLLSSVQSELKKAERESVKAKLKEVLKKRNEAEKTIRMLDLEAKKLVDDFNNGVL